MANSKVTGINPLTFIIVIVHRIDASLNDNLNEFRAFNYIQL